MSDFIVNNTRVGLQESPNVTALADGRFVAVWDSSDGDHQNIRMRIFNSNGTPASTGDFVVNTAVEHTTAPTVAGLPDGRFIVSWMNYGDQVNSGYTIRGRLYNSDGTPVDGEFTVNTTIGTHSEASVTALSNNRFVFTWTSTEAGTTDVNVRARIYNANGTPAGSDFEINTTTLGPQSETDVVGLSDGRFVAMWQSYEPTGYTIRGRIFGNDGTPAGDDFVVDGAGIWPEIAALPGGRFVVTWEDSKVRLYNADGTPAGSAETFGTTTTYGKYAPVVTGLPDGRFFVVWHSFEGESTTETEIRGQVFKADGTPEGDDFVVNTTTVDSQESPHVATLPDGRVVVTWASHEGGSTVRDIRGIVLDLGGGSGPGPTNTAPTAPTTNSVATNEDTASIAVAIGASDADNDALSYALKAGFLPAKGAVAFSGGSFVYTPNADENGADSFTIVVSDGRGGVTEQVVSVTIAAVNDAPVATGPVRLTPMAQDSGPRLITQAELLANASDIDGPSLAVMGLFAPTGTLVNNGNGTWSYTPAAGDSSAVSFSYVVTDGSAYITASATLDLTPVDSAPPTTPPTPPTPPEAPPVPPVTSGDDNIKAPTGTSAFDAGLGVDTITFDFRLVDASIEYQGNKIVVDGPGGNHTELTGFEVFAFTDGTVNNNDGNWLVDDLFYYARNHDVWNARLDAETHYNASGWRENRDPNAFFDTSIYLSANPDVKAAGVNPLTHFDQAGWKEGRAASLTFDSAQYLAANPDVRAANLDPLAHYLQQGQQEGRIPFAPTELLTANGFDFVYYVQQNPDVAASGLDPFQHYQSFGWKEGRDPNALFDTDAYLAAYADVKAAGINPLDHYHQFGWKEGRDPSPAFDTSDYLAAYADVKAAGIDPLTHYLDFGRHEGRSAFGDGIWG